MTLINAIYKFNFQTKNAIVNIFNQIKFNNFLIFNLYLYLMMKKYRISISIEKRIILHLADYIENKNKTEVVIDITQFGIANSMAIRIEHVSRSVIKLVEDGLLFVRSTPIRGLNRRKKAYFLTKKGIGYAKKIKDWFGDKSILIRNLDDEIREIKFKHLKNLLNYEIKPLEAYKIISVSDEGIIDLKKMMSIRDNEFELNLAF
jgi:DNA-binding MarR family transcriptional regulator